MTKPNTDPSTSLSKLIKVGLMALAVFIAASLLLGETTRGCAAESRSACELVRASAGGVSIPGAEGARGAAQMKVFARPTRRDDAPSPEIERLLSSIDCPNRCSQLPGRTRLLLAGDSPEIRVYAVPTSLGSVCWLLGDFGPGACNEIGAFGWGITEQQGELCNRVVVAGVVPDHVRAVDIVAAGQRYPARLGSNAFAADLRAPGVDHQAVTAIVYRLKGGREFEADVSFST